MKDNVVFTTPEILDVTEVEKEKIKQSEETKRVKIKEEAETKRLQASKSFSKWSDSYFLAAFVTACIAITIGVCVITGLYLRYKYPAPLTGCAESYHDVSELNSKEIKCGPNQKIVPKVNRNLEEVSGKYICKCE